jgi:hypothetical protein
VVTRKKRRNWIVQLRYQMGLIDVLGERMGSKALVGAVEYQKDATPTSSSRDGANG